MGKFKTTENKRSKESVKVVTIINIIVTGIIFCVPQVFAQTTFNLGDVNGNAHGFEFLRAEAGDELGYSVTGLGDFNGDGIDDMAMSAPYAADNFGQVYIVYGRRGPWPKSTRVTEIDGTIGFIIQGAEEYSGFGIPIAGIGDINGDGFGDLLIGRGFIIFGSSTPYPALINIDDINSYNGIILQSEVPDDRLGSEVSRAGDFNNDGLMDFMIGAPKADSVGGVENEFGEIPGEERGKIYLIYGNADYGTANGPDTLKLDNIDGDNGFVLVGSQDNLRIGSYPFVGIKSAKTMDTAGDFNGDGYDDLIIGAPSYDISNFDFNAGRAYLILGGATSPGGTSEVQITPEELPAGRVIIFNGENGVDLAGTSVAGGADINEDGYDDILIGAPKNDTYATDGGEVYIIYGYESSPAKIVATNTPVELKDISQTGDNPNGVKVAEQLDVKENSNTGFVLTFSETLDNDKDIEKFVVRDFTDMKRVRRKPNGESSAFVVDTRFAGEYPISQSGSSMADVGDVNGDGRSDIAIGDPCESGPYFDFEDCSRVTIITDSYDGYIDGGPGSQFISSPVEGQFLDNLTDQLQIYSPEVQIWQTVTQEFFAVEHFDIVDDDDDEDDDEFDFPGKRRYKKIAALINLFFSASNKITASNFNVNNRIYFSVPGSIIESDSLMKPNELPGIFFSDLPDGYFAFVGNPILDSIDVKSMMKSDSAINLSESYYRIHLNEQGNREWSFTNGIVGNSSSEIMPPFEGFFVQAYGGNASLSIDSTMIVSTEADTSMEIEHQTLRLNLSSNNSSTSTYLSVMNEELIENGRDVYDALLFAPFTESWLSMGSITSEGEVYSINAMSPDTSSVITIPLLIEGNTGVATGSISLSGAENLPDNWTYTIFDAITEQEAVFENELAVEISIGTSVFSDLVSINNGNPLPKLISANGDTVRYSLKLYPEGTFTVSNEAEQFGIPQSAALYQNYPNPFNPSTKISYSLPEARLVKLDIINILGQRVATLVNEQKAAGNYTINFDASGLSSGVYFYTIEAGEFSQTMKMLLIK